jgi:hypothetical protein
VIYELLEVRGLLPVLVQEELANHRDCEPNEADLQQQVRSALPMPVRRALQSEQESEVAAR